MARATRVGAALLAWLAIAAGAAAQAPADPPWVADVVGHYAGKIRNAGEIQCHITDFTLKDGHLVGHYHIEDAEPFDGDMTDFVPEAENAGTFTWRDRYGVGREFVVFSPDHTSFTGAWGLDAVDPHNTVWGMRSGTAGCAGAVS